MNALSFDIGYTNTNKLYISDSITLLDNEPITNTQLYKHLNQTHPTNCVSTIGYDDVLLTKEHKLLRNLYSNEESFQRTKANALMDFMYWEGYIFHLDGSLFIGFCVDHRDKEVVHSYVNVFDLVKYNMRDYMRDHFLQFISALDSTILAQQSYNI